MCFSLRYLIGLANTPDDSVLDYTYISEESFLIVILLTAQGNIVSYYKTGCTVRTQTTSIREIHREWCEPILIAITSDARSVATVLSNGGILLLPIKLLLVDFHQKG
jgi:hypothetical protein